MKTVVMTAALLVIGITSSWAWSQAQGPSKAAIMRAKLVATQSALEGIAMEDHTKLAKAADELVALTDAAAWQVNKDERYVRFSSEFRALALQLRRSAQQRQLDAATLCYVRMTMACVDCHKFLRDPNLIKPVSLSAGVGNTVSLTFGVSVDP